MDNIRWITVVLVVLYHVIYIYNGVEVHGVIGPFYEIQYQDVFQYLVYPWFMLLLFVVSGMSARFYLKNHTGKEFLKNRTIKCLVPSTLGLLVFGWVLGYYNMQMSGAFEAMGQVPKPVLFLIMAVSGSGPLWYIQVLWVLSVVLLLVRKIEKDRLSEIFKNTPVLVIVLLTLPIWGAAQILNTPIIVVYRFGIYGLGFFLGYFIFSQDEVMERLSKWWLPLTMAAIVCCVCFVVMYWQKPYAEHEVLDTLMCNVYAWMATVGILSFMRKWGDFENEFTGFMNKKSWGLYLFHYLPIAMCAYYLSIYAKEMPAVLCYILVAVSAFVGGYLLYEVLSRIPVICYLVCGIGGKK